MLRSDHSAFLSPRVSTLYTLLALAALAVATGCSPKIGDKCTVSTDCSATGDRLCDITQPDGYCTIFNCEPDSCPDDAACINFGTSLSLNAAAACTVSQGESPYQRSFCLAGCESDSDCRADYSCVEPESIGGRKADMFRSNKVCAVPEATDPVKALMGNSSQVCLGSDAGPVSDMSGGGSASDAGTDGQSSGGMSGAGTDEAGAGG
jgi:hypothetical protein